MQIASLAGTITLTSDCVAWTISAESVRPEADLEEIRLRFAAPRASPPPRVTLAWSLPHRDIQARWYPNAAFRRNLAPDWADGAAGSNLASSAPVMTLLNQSGDNRLTFAVSEVRRQVDFKAGINEETNAFHCAVELFSAPEAPLSDYEATLRLDRRPVFYADALRDVARWFAAMPEYRLMVAPASAWEPLYSTWYSYHQDVFAEALEKECAEATAYGMKVIIVDDGWQTDDTNRGYAFCGDWEVSPRRFPDLRAHVERVHRLGMKYMLWYAVPFMGMKSHRRERFAGKFLYTDEKLGAHTLDPRFPEVRDYLCSTYENAVREWNIDGFKLDFIDCFHFRGVDPAIAENYAGRDILSLPLAVDALFREILQRLRALKPDMLIEFRQSYIGPAMRQYGTMFRAGDCPADLLANRAQTLDLRLTSGETPVHSDMLEWDGAERPEIAALQVLNILFSVPQISVRMADFPEAHRRMLRFWMEFWRSHRAVLMHGRLRPFHPELNYPLVMAENETETVVAVYHAESVVRIEGRPNHPYHIVNATGEEALYLDIAKPPKTVAVWDTQGAKLDPPTVIAGLARIPVPSSGLLELSF